MEKEDGRKNEGMSTISKYERNEKENTYANDTCTNCSTKFLKNGHVTNKMSYNSRMKSMMNVCNNTDFNNIKYCVPKLNPRTQKLHLVQE